MSRWLTTFSSALPWVTVALFAGQAAPSNKEAASPSPSGSVQKKAKPSAKAPARRTKAAVKKPATRPPAVVPQPLAEIPELKQPASVWRGCLDSHDLPRFASSIGVEVSRLEPVLAEQGIVVAENGECVPYVAATGGENGAASAILQRSKTDAGESRILDIRKASDGITVTPGACDCGENFHRTLEFPAADATERPDEVLASVPANIRWQLESLIPQMTVRIVAKKAVSDSQPLPGANAFGPSHNPEGSDGPPLPAAASAQTFRIVLARDGEHEMERLQAIEIVESATGKPLDGAWWLQRNGSPGVLIGMEGVAYERLLWQSAVKYVHKSRGVGQAVTTYRRSIKPKGGGKPLVRTFSARMFHSGADLLAPKGTEVNAVADAKVAFAGRRGGYGNLIILDHGLGYQTYYAHLSKIQPAIKMGASVSRGDDIGRVGSTGRSTAPHLHFEIRKGGKFIDPFDETHQLEFWVLSPDDQERLGMELLAAPASHAQSAGPSFQTQ